MGGFFSSIIVPWLGDRFSYFSFNLVLLVWLGKSTDPFTGSENMNPGSDKKVLVDKKIRIRNPDTSPVQDSSPRRASDRAKV
jgi:hypothetical protein